MNITHQTSFKHELDGKVVPKLRTEAACENERLKTPNRQAFLVKHPSKFEGDQSSTSNDSGHVNPVKENAIS